MKNFTQQLKTAFLLSALVLLVITVKAQSGNYFERKDGTIVKLYGEKAYLNGVGFYYTNEKGKELKEKTDNIKLIIMGGKVLINLPYLPNSKADDLHSIIAYNDKYVVALEQYGRYINIFDREFNFVNKDKIRYFKLEEVYLEHIDQYFKECADFKDAWFKCIDNSKSPATEITYFNCNNALDLITNKPVEKSNVMQQNNSTRKDYYIKTDGEKINLVVTGPESYKFGESFKYRVGAIGFIDVPADNIKFISKSNKIFAPFKLENKKTLMEVLAFNNNYVLSGVYKPPYGAACCGTPDIFYVYNRQSNTLDGQIKKEEDVISFVKKYFPDCTELIRLMEDNKKNHRNLLFEVTYFNCNGAKELIEGIELN